MPVNRRVLEDEHTRVLSRAVGDHLYELALRASELAARVHQTS
jgi:hypothetical protein